MSLAREYLGFHRVTRAAHTGILNSHHNLLNLPC